MYKFLIMSAQRALQYFDLKSKNEGKDPQKHEGDNSTWGVVIL